MRMEIKANKTEKTQGVITVKEAEAIATAIEKTADKKQKASASYTIRAFKENIKKFKELVLITCEEEEELMKIHKKIAEEWMRKELGI